MTAPNGVAAPNGATERAHKLWGGRFGAWPGCASKLGKSHETLRTQLKALDPHRLVVGNSPCFTNFHVVTDIEVEEATSIGGRPGQSTANDDEVT